MSKRVCEERPILTLAVPTYNRRDIVLKTIRNLFANDLHKKNCVLVIDNCSTDGTVSALNKEFGAYQNFEVIEQNENGGLFGNIIALHRAVKTKHVCINSDEDDFSAPGINDLVNYLARNSIKFLSGSVMTAPPKCYRASNKKIDPKSIRSSANYLSGLVYDNDAVLENLSFLEGCSDIELFWLYPMFALAMMTFLNYPSGCVCRDLLLSVKHTQSESLIEGTVGEKYYSFESRIKQMRSVQEAQARLKAHFPASEALIDSWASYEKNRALQMVRDAFRKDSSLDLECFDNGAQTFYLKKIIKKVLPNRQ